MFENEIFDYSSNNKKKTCLNCYNWHALRCDCIYSENYGRITLQNCTCDVFAKCNGFDEIEEEKVQELKVEKVDHPVHYNQGIEAIDIIESWKLNFSLGNAIKYILRAPHKGTQLEDLEKSLWYIKREIERLKKNKKEVGLMKIEFSVSCLGYSIGGHNNSFEIEIEGCNLEGMNEKEKEEYIEKCIYEYILEDIEYGYKIIE